MILKASSLCLLTAAALSAPAAAVADIPSWTQSAIDSGLALTGLNGIAVVKSLGNIKGTCNALNLKVRQEWYVTFILLLLRILVRTEPLYTEETNRIPTVRKGGRKNVYRVCATDI